MKTHHPTDPAPKTGRVQNQGVTLLVAQNILEENIEVRQLAGIIQSLNTLIEAEAGPSEEGMLALKLSLFPDREPTCEFKFNGALTQDFLQRIYDNIAKLPPVKTKAAPVAVQVVFAIVKAVHGGH